MQQSHQLYCFHPYNIPSPHARSPQSPSSGCIKRRISTEQLSQTAPNKDLPELFKKLKHAITENREDTALKQKLEDFIDNKLLPVPPDSPFFSTDLVIFKDDYKGMLPLNGVTLSQYKNIVLALQKIAENKTNINIEGNPQFQTKVLDSLKILLTRRIGRKLLYFLCSHTDKHLLITPTTPRHSDSETRPGSSHKNAKIYFSIDSTNHVNVRDPKTGRKCTQPVTRHVELAHELIHVLRLFKSGSKEAYHSHAKKPPTLNRKFHNLEEQETIATKVDRPLQFPTTLQMAEMLPWPEDDPMLPGNEGEQEQITENSISSVFESSSSLPRIDHSGCLPRPENLNVKEPETIQYFLDACQEGIFDVVKELLDMGIDPNATDPDDPQKKTGMMMAAQHGEWETLKLLHERGADPAKTTTDGLHILHFAIESDDPEFFKKVADLENVFILDADKAPTPLIHYAFLCSIENFRSMFTTLLGKGASVWKTMMPNGETVLHAAAAIFDVQLFVDLVKMRIDPSKANKFGIRPLHSAFYEGNLPLVKYLFTPSENLHQLTPFGKSLMLFAAWSGNIEVVDFLLDLERQYSAAHALPFRFIDRQDNEGGNPMSYAFRKAEGESGAKYILELMRRGFQVSPKNYPEFVTLFADSDPATREKMLDLVYDQPGYINAPICQNAPLLNYAVGEGDLDLACYALKKRAETNLPITAQLEWSALHEAVDLNRRDLVKLLMDHGARPDAKDIDGETSMDIVKAKLANGEAVDPLINELLQGLHSRTPVRVFLQTMQFQDLSEPS